MKPFHPAQLEQSHFTVYPVPPPFYSLNPYITLKMIRHSVQLTFMVSFDNKIMTTEKPSAVEVLWSRQLISATSDIKSILTRENCWVSILMKRVIKITR